MNQHFHGLHKGWVLTLLAVLLAISGCHKPKDQTSPLRAVKLQQVGSKEAKPRIQVYSGEVRARQESRLGFRVGGKLTARPVQLGQQVQAGSLLAALDPRDYQLGAQAAQAQVQAATSARDLAAADLARYEGLQAQGFISSAQIERARAQLKATQSQLAQAKAQAGVQGNQAAYGNLYADRAGVITAIYAEPGQVVSAGQPVVALAQDGARDVVISLPEDDRKHVTPGTAVRIAAWSSDEDRTTNEGAAWTGQVREVAASADPVTRTFQTKVAIHASPVNAPALGSTVKVESTVHPLTANGMVLPLSSLKREGGKTQVWVYDATTQTVRMRAIQTLEIQGNEVQVSSGLKPGEWVVVAGVHTLTEGERVTRYEGRPQTAVHDLQPHAPAGAKT